MILTLEATPQLPTQPLDIAAPLSPELSWDADPELAMAYVALREAVSGGWGPDHHDVRATYTVARQMGLSNQQIRMLHLFVVDEIGTATRC